MGCFGSRFDKRAGVADDLNTVAFQFVGGEAHENDYCPIDKIAFTYGKEKEPADWAKVAAGMKATDEELGKAVALELDAALTTHAKWLESEYGTPDKDVFVGGKYELKDAKAQIAAVKAFLREKCNNVGDYPVDEVKEEPAMDDAMADMMAAMEDPPVEMEGGDEMEAMAKEDLYASDAGSYDGWENLPALILRNYVVNPYFGDLIKRDIVCAEFKPSSPKHAEFTSAAVMVGMALDATESAEKDIFFAGYLGADDIESLKTIPENGNILFPGIVAAWASEEEAVKNSFGTGENGKNPITKVCFTAKTKVHSAIVCREFVYRFNAKVEKQEDKEGVLHITLADDTWEHKTLAAWG